LFGSCLDCFPHAATIPCNRGGTKAKLDATCPGSYASSHGLYVGIPNRDFLIAWSSDFSGFAAFVAQIGKDARQQAYPVSGALFVVSRDGVRSATAAERRLR
jgi:hypothetical protein